MKLQPSRHCFKGNVEMFQRQCQENGFSEMAGLHIWAFLSIRYHLDLTELRSLVINIELGFYCVWLLSFPPGSLQADPATEIMSVTANSIFLHNASSHNKLTAINHQICTHKKNKLPTVKCTGLRTRIRSYVSVIDPVYVQHLSRKTFDPARSPRDPALSAIRGL